MGFFENTAEKAKEVFEETGKVANEVLETQKLKFKRSSIESEIRTNLEKLGKYAYLSKMKGGDFSEQSEQLCEEIKALIEEEKAIDLELAERKGKKLCSCGAYNIKDAKFCNECGKEI